MARLDDAIDAIYAAFRNARKPRWIDSCPCCASPEYLEQLLAPQLRQLTADDLSSYAYSAITTIGAASDYLYFLPRILELHATDKAFFPDPEVTGWRVGQCEANGWSEQRNQALDEYLHALLYSLLDPSKHLMIDSWLCAIVRMNRDVRPYLHIVGHCREATLAVFTDNANELQDGKLSNAFWEEPCDGYRAIVDWLRSDRVLQAAHEAYGYVLPKR